MLQHNTVYLLAESAISENSYFGKQKVAFSYLIILLSMQKKVLLITNTEFGNRDNFLLNLSPSKCMRKELHSSSWGW